MFDRPPFAKKTFLKVCGSLTSRAAPIPINSKMHHVAKQFILKTISVQKFFILVLKFNHFLFCCPKITLCLQKFGANKKHKQTTGIEKKTLLIWKLRSSTT